MSVIQIYKYIMEIITNQKKYFIIFLGYLTDKIFHFLVRNACFQLMKILIIK